MPLSLRSGATWAVYRVYGCRMWFYDRLRLPEKSRGLNRTKMSASRYAAPVGGTIEDGTQLLGKGGICRIGKIGVVGQ